MKNKINLNVVWVEDIEKSQKGILYSLEPDLDDLDITINPIWLKSGKDAASTVWEMNRDRGKAGFTDTINIAHLMLVDYNLEESHEDGQTTGLNGQQVIIETRVHDNEIPIIFYTANNDVDLQDLVSGYPNIISVHRDDIIPEIIRLIKSTFLK